MSVTGVLQLLAGAWFIAGAAGEGFGGDDFANNLFSDLAPILSLFGERVTMQFMSQSMGWADNVILAMVPLGIITAVVSTIRVGGPTWLKALIGRAWESRAIVESELMSSTSNEVCELWNGQQIVRVMGEGQIREFIILVADASDGTAPGETRPDTDIPAPTAVTENMNAAPAVGTESESEGIANSAADGGEGSDRTPSATSEYAEDSEGTQDTSEDTEDSDSTQDSSETAENSNGTLSVNGKPGDLSNDTAANLEFMELRDDDKKKHLAEYRPSAWDVILGRSSPHREGFFTKYGIPALFRSRKRAKATDIEKATPVGDSHMAIEQPENKVPGSKSPRRPVAVVRNTVVHTPNISLNIRNKSTSREAYVVAVFGTFLQSCLLVYAGLTATYLSDNAQLQENPPAGYAFPCIAAGTLMVVSGMLVCGHVVEGSTSERRYRPADGKEARVVWLQRSGIVNDQSFESFAIFPTKAQAVITTSQRTRQGRNSTSQEPSVGITVEMSTMVAAAITICGFVVQFVGLRGINWTVSIAQLAATLLMAVLRSLVRRNLAERPNAQPLPLGHELDWLAMTLANPSNAAWLHPDKHGGDDERRDKYSRPWTNHDSHGWDYRIIPVEKPKNTAAPGDHTDARNSRAHQAMLMRRDLGALAKWRGPASAEAVALARAIEMVMDTLVGPERGTDILTWHLTSSSCGVHEPVTFRAVRESRSRGLWKASPDEIEAALSLWLYSVCHREKNQEETAYGSGSWLGGATWPQSKRAPGKRSLILLGSLDARILERDLGWWLPDSSFTKVLELSEKSKSHNMDYVVDAPLEVEAHRVVGFAQNAIDDPPTDIDVCLYRTQRQVGYTKHDIDRQSTLAVDAHSDLKTLYAHHIFSAFMWAVAAAIAESEDVLGAHILGEAEIRTFLARTGPHQHASWDTDTFRNEKLSALVRDIETTGLGSVDDIYFGILPPLSAWNLLPPVHAILKRGLELGHELEQRRGWRGAGSTYVRLLKRTALFPRDNSTDIASEATVLVMEFLRVLTETAKLWQSQLFDDMEISELLMFTKWVKARAAAYNDPAIFPRLMGLYERQGRAWKCDLLVGDNASYPAIKPPEFGFHALHQAACDDDIDEADARDMSYPNPKAGLDAQDFLGWTAIHYAVACGSDSAFDSLLKLRADVNAQDVRRRTPLHYAYRQDDEQVVRELLRAGADINARDTDGMTPLHDAAKHGARKVAAALIEAGADMNPTDNGGRTPLAWVLYSGHGDLAREYLWDATNKKQRDKYGRTPLHLAAMAEGVAKDFGEMFGFLVPAIDKDVKDIGGYTPLHFAAAKGHLSAVQWLLGQGANPQAKDDEYQRTPLHLAELRLQRAEEEGGIGTDDDSDEEGWEWEAGSEEEWVDDSSEEGEDASFYKLRLGPDAIKGLEDVIRVLMEFEEGGGEDRATEEGDVEERGDEEWETEDGDAEDGDAEDSEGSS
ncbi:hypothetical protein C8A00DRAFT_18785 [Chaetomidium leptoderma]|uniref:Ankyrin repeat protein n=1 Tax=Chaetomidium leptoderma TaxID=669021 RepID=A0AAN6VDN4_9PEZI|nr:hypothetical protein C8A00DRAFT_18785 [Chaetomidium leptoderma]